MNDLIRLIFEIITCAVTLDIFEHPVTDNEGNTYEEASIMQIWNTPTKISPITRNRMTILVPNRALESIIPYIILLQKEIEKLQEEMEREKEREEQVSSSSSYSSASLAIFIEENATLKVSYACVSKKIEELEQRYIDREQFFHKEYKELSDREEQINIASSKDRNKIDVLEKLLGGECLSNRGLGKSYLLIEKCERLEKNGNFTQQEKCNRLERENEKYKEEYKEEKRQMDDYKIKFLEEKRKLKTNLSENDKKIISLEQKLGDLEQKLNFEKHDVAMQAMQIGMYKEENEKLKTEKSENVKKIMDFGDIYQSICQELGESNKMGQEYKEENEKLKKELRELSTTDFGSNPDVFSAVIKKLTDEKKEFTTTLQQKENELKETVLMLEERNARIQQIQFSSEQEENELTRKINELIDELTEKDNEKSKIISVLGMKTDEVKHKGCELAEKKNEIDTLNKRYKQLQNNYDLLETDLEQSKTKKNEHSATIKKMKKFMQQILSPEDDSDDEIERINITQMNPLQMEKQDEAASMPPYKPRENKIIPRSLISTFVPPQSLLSSSSEGERIRNNLRNITYSPTINVPIAFPSVPLAKPKDLLPVSKGERFRKQWNDEIDTINWPFAKPNDLLPVSKVEILNEGKKETILEEVNFDLESEWSDLDLYL